MAKSQEPGSPTRAAFARAWGGRAGVPSSRRFCACLGWKSPRGGTGYIRHNRLPRPKKVTKNLPKTNFYEKHLGYAKPDEATLHQGRHRGTPDYSSRRRLRVEVPQ